MTGEVVGEAKVTGTRAEVWTDFDFVGKVDPTGRFSRSLDGSPPVRGPIASRRKYSLSLTNQHSRPGSQAIGHQAIQEAGIGPSQVRAVDVIAQAD